MMQLVGFFIGQLILAALVYFIAYKIKPSFKSLGIAFLLLAVRAVICFFGGQWIQGIIVLITNFLLWLILLEKFKTTEDR